MHDSRLWRLLLAAAPAGGRQLQERMMKRGGA